MDSWSSSIGKSISLILSRKTNCTVIKHHGKGDLETIAKEIVGFTTMYCNSFNSYTKLPATMDTSNTLAQIGNLLKQYKGVTYDYRYFI